MHRTDPPQQGVFQPQMSIAPRLNNIALGISFVPVVIIPHLCDFLWWSVSSRRADKLLVLFLIKPTAAQVLACIRQYKVINDCYSSEHDLASNHEKAMATKVFMGTSIFSSYLKRLRHRENHAYALGSEPGIHVALGN